MDYHDIIEFWFEELNPQQWFEKDEELDELIRQRYSSVLDRAIKGELYSWRTTPLGRLAEIIVLDQFPRNIFRGSSQAFENDGLALFLSQELVTLGLDQDIPLSMRAFAYMPHMHSESAVVHNEAVKLFSTEGMEENLDFEIDHKKIIDQFGRFPHRNPILGRESTIPEKEFLKDHDGF